MKPLVSTIITTYNQAEYIAAAIESALAQTYAEQEIIVVDDGSTDDTSTRIATFASRVTSIRQANAGVAASRNSGVRLAKGPLLAFLDGDDAWERDKLEIQVAAALAEPLSGLIVVDGTQFDTAGTLRDSLIGADVRRHLGQADSVTFD